MGDDDRERGRRWADNNEWWDSADNDEEDSALPILTPLHLVQVFFSRLINFALPLA